MAAENAPEALGRILRDQLGPVLRRHGFRGSGQNYRRSDERSWSCVGFQRSTSSTRSVLHFTVNLSVVDKHAYAEERRSYPRLPEQPPASGGLLSETWASRLGNLIPPCPLLSFESFGPHGPNPRDSSYPIGRHDRWWTLTSETANEVAERVLHLLVTHGLPAQEAERMKAEAPK